MTTYFACDAARSANCAGVLAGGGSEELLAGYARHAQRPTRDIDEMSASGLRSLHRRDLQRDHAVCVSHGLSGHAPFLSAYVAPHAALEIPSRLKLLPGGAEKRVLRVALSRAPLSVPAELWTRKKCAAQYGSRFHVALQKVARRLGLGGGKLAEAVAMCEHIGARDLERIAEEDTRANARPSHAPVEARRLTFHLPPPPPPTHALIYSSGHGSATSFHTALLQRRLCSVIVPFRIPDDDDDDADADARGRRERIRGLRAAAAAFSEATGIPSWTRGVPAYTPATTDRKRFDEAAIVASLAAALKQLRAAFPALQGVVTGHCHDLRSLSIAEAACERVGVHCLAPSWGQARPIH